MSSIDCSERLPKRSAAAAVRLRLTLLIIELLHSVVAAGWLQGLAAELRPRPHWKRRPVVLETRPPP